MNAPTIWTPPEPVIYEATSPLEYVRGDGKPFWRPCIRGIHGSDVTEELAMTERYDGWLEERIIGWENITPGYISSIPRHETQPKLCSSRKKAIRISKRAAKKRNKEQLMLIRKV